MIRSSVRIFVYIACWLLGMRPDDEAGSLLSVAGEALVTGWKMKKAMATASVRL